jgi:tetratricopeptide (TPR) repeat protein
MSAPLRSPRLPGGTLFPLALWLCLALAAPPAWAQTQDQQKDQQKAAARGEVQKAQTHYKLGRFDEALEAYSRAYEIFNAPALLFNIGQCHKNLKNYERAIFFFEGYLREETKVDAQKRRLADELIAESRAELERQRTAEASAAAEARTARPGATPPSGPAPAESQAATPVPPASSVAAVFGAPPPLPSAAPSLVDAAPPAATGRPLTHRWWFWTALGAGAVVLAGGALAYFGSGETKTVLPGGTIGILDRR